MARQDDLLKYDTAMERFILATFPSITKVVYAKTELAFKRYEEKHRSQVKYPFASYARLDDANIDETRYNTASHRLGIAYSAGDQQATGTALKARVIPVNLQYQIDLWGAQQTDINLWEQDWYMASGRGGSLLVDELVPGVQGRATFTGVSLTDNTDLEQETDRGRIYRLTISLTAEASVTDVGEVKVITNVTTNTHVDEPFPQR